MPVPLNPPPPLFHVCHSCFRAHSEHGRRPPDFLPRILTTDAATGAAAQHLRRARIASAVLAGLVVFGGWEAAFRSARVEPRAPLGSLTLPGGRPIGVVRSEASEWCIGSAEFAQHANRWRLLLQGAGHAIETIGDSQLETGLDKYAALILPSVVCLGDPARVEIERYVRGGGGVVATWALGARDDLGVWRGYDFLQALTGALRFEIDARQAPWFVSVRSGSPLGAGLPGGARIQVTSLERLEATALEVDAFWSDARLRPRNPGLPDDYQGAVVRKEIGEGRVVWLGFHESSSVTGEAERAAALLLNSAAWAAGRPLVAIEPWPAPFASSVLVAVDVAEYPDRARRLALVLAEARVPATFFVDPSLAGDRELVGELKAAGELALKWRHDNNVGRVPHAVDRLKIDWARLALWSPSWVWARGVRPFGDTLDQAGAEFLGEAGVRYFLAAGGVDSVLPSSRSVRRAPEGLTREGSIVSLGRSTDDDLHLSPLGLEGLNPEWIVRRVQDDSEGVFRLGGLYVLSLHTQGLGGPQYLPALRTILSQIGASKSWIARGGDLADWWSARSRISVSLSAPSPTSLRLDIVSRANRPSENLAFSLYPGHLRGNPRVVSSVSGEAPRATLDAARGRIVITLPRLESGRPVRLEVSFVR